MIMGKLKLERRHKLLGGAAYNLGPTVVQKGKGGFYAYERGERVRRSSCRACRSGEENYHSKIHINIDMSYDYPVSLIYR